MLKSTVHPPGEAAFHSQDRGLSVAWNVGVSDIHLDTSLSINTSNPCQLATVQQDNFGFRRVYLRQTAWDYIPSVVRYHPVFDLFHSRNLWDYFLGDQATTERGVSEIHDRKATGENLYARKNCGAIGYRNLCHLHRLHEPQCCGLSGFYGLPGIPCPGPGLWKHSWTGYERLHPGTVCVCLCQYLCLYQHDVSVQRHLSKALCDPEKSLILQSRETVVSIVFEFGSFIKNL